MRRISLTFCALVAFVANSFASSATYADYDQPIDYKKLPAEARTFIEKNFGSEAPAYITEDKGIVDSEYSVKFESGTEIEFDSKGAWTEIDCRNGEVPSALVPKKIAAHVAKNYHGQKITELKRERNGWEAMLSNGLELTFNNDFRIVEIDD